MSAKSKELEALAELRKKHAAACGCLSRMHGILRLSHAESAEEMIDHLDAWLTIQQNHITNNSECRGYLYLYGKREETPTTPEPEAEDDNPCPF